MSSAVNASVTGEEGALMERMSAHRSGSRFQIADDQALFAETLQSYLEKSYTVVGVVLNGRAMVSPSVNQKAFGTPKPRDISLENPPVVWERGYL
jgi:hypothetical protein